MTQEELQAFARGQPFRPFRVVITTGQTFDVRHPDLIMVGRRSVVLGITNDPAGAAYDRTYQVDLLHVVGVEELPVPSAPSGSGSASPG
jgi:hypothetical protein